MINGVQKSIVVVQLFLDIQVIPVTTRLMGKIKPEVDKHLINLEVSNGWHVV